MTDILGTLIPGGIWPMIIGGIAIGAICTAGGVIVEHKIDSVPLAQSQTETANAKAALSAYEAAVAAKIAAADAAALAEKERQQTALNDLQAKLAQTTREANVRSARLQALLDSAKPGEIRAIGPAASRYYDGLRGSSIPAAAPAPGSP